MEKAFAYLCTAEETSSRLLKRYCRKVLELGYIPICPAFCGGKRFSENVGWVPKSRSFAVSKGNQGEAAEAKLPAFRQRRNSVLVVCGNEITSAMSSEIGQAEKRNLICTTLEGLAKIKEADGSAGLSR